MNGFRNLFIELLIRSSIVITDRNWFYPGGRHVYPSEEDSMDAGHNQFYM